MVGRPVTKDRIKEPCTRRPRWTTATRVLPKPTRCGNRGDHRPAEPSGSLATSTITPPPSPRSRPASKTTAAAPILRDTGGSTPDIARRGVKNVVGFSEPASHVSECTPNASSCRRRRGSRSQPGVRESHFWRLRHSTLLLNNKKQY